jgi:sugar/nucleoside kinase (ribokinase family)
MYYNDFMPVLTIGSSLFDAIIALENHPQIPVIDHKATFSLGDKIPIDIKAFSIGGNAANVSSSLHKLGVENYFYTYIGHDALSQFIVKQLTDEGLSLIVESIDSGDGPLSLIFDFTEDRTIFSHHPEFPHPFDESKITKKPDFIFLTSIGKKWADAYEKVLAYASKESIPVAFSPGSAQMKDMNETFVKTVHQSKMLLCNMEEARKIHETLSGSQLTDNKELLLDLKNYGFDILSITDGANGSYAVDQDGKVYKIDTMKPEGHEKTGAGDAYAGAFFASHVNGLTISDCMKRGVLNSVGVMGKIGAHTGQLKKEEMEQKANATDLTAVII